MTQFYVRFQTHRAVSERARGRAAFARRWPLPRQHPGRHPQQQIDAAQGQDGDLRREAEHGRVRRSTLRCSERSTDRHKGEREGGVRGGGDTAALVCSHLQRHSYGHCVRVLESSAAHTLRSSSSEESNISQGNAWASLYTSPPLVAARVCVPPRPTPATQSSTSARVTARRLSRSGGAFRL